VIDALDELDTRIKAGKAVFSGDGTTITFPITHGFDVEPTVVLIGEASADAMGHKYWTVDAKEITVIFETPPPEGTENVQLWWLAIKL